MKDKIQVQFKKEDRKKKMFGIDKCKNSDVCYQWWDKNGAC